jgi:2-iminobutanoate/2-iminopropanoate deaminase
MPRAILTLLLLSAVSALAFDRKAIVPPGFSSSGPFSPGILVDGNTLYAAGQVGRDPKTKSIPAEFEAEVSAALDNVGAILHEAGMDFRDVVSVQVYLTDMELFDRMNAVYMKRFPEPRPARTTVGVAKLVGTARIEITVTARKEGPVVRPASGGSH